MSVNWEKSCEDLREGSCPHVRKKALTRNQICYPLDLVLPASRIVRKDMFTQSMIFHYCSLNRLITHYRSGNYNTHIYTYMHTHVYVCMYILFYHFYLALPLCLGVIDKDTASDDNYVKQENVLKSRAFKILTLFITSFRDPGFIQSWSTWESQVLKRWTSVSKVYIYNIYNSFIFIYFYSITYFHSTFCLKDLPVIYISIYFNSFLMMWKISFSMLGIYFVSFPSGYESLSSFYSYKQSCSGHLPSWSFWSEIFSRG